MLLHSRLVTPSSVRESRWPSAGAPVHGRVRELALVLVVVLVVALALVRELALAVLAPVEALALREGVVGRRTCAAQQGPSVSAS